MARLSRLGKLVVAVNVVVGLITIGIPLMQFFLVFNMAKQHMHILITTGVCALLCAVLGCASALARGPLLPALHVVAAILLAALMGSFNTQTYLDLDHQCNIAQAVYMGCAPSCTCAATNSCTEKLLAASECSSCRAPATDFCARVRWQALLMPYTGLIEAVLLAIPGFLSLLLLLQHTTGSVSVSSLSGKGAGDVKVMVNAWPGQSTSEQEDWPSATPAAAPPAKRAPSSKHAAAPEQHWQQQQGGLQQQGDMVTDLGGAGLQQETSGYMGTGSLATTGPSEHELGAGEPKKKAPGLKKKLKSSVAAARAEAAL